MLKPLSILVLALPLLGCGGGSAKYGVQSHLERHEFAAEIGEELYVNVGDSFFVSGEIQTHTGVETSNRIASTMPGAYGVPFNFSINQTVLEPRFQTDQHVYYCGADSEVGASFPGLGRVISNGDCVGIRSNKIDGSYEWVVDNSIHNRQNTVWHRRVRVSDNVEFTDAPLFGGGRLTEIIFDGYYSELVHFTFRDGFSNPASEDEFRFELSSSGPTRVGIRGHVFEILSVDNVGMAYRWISSPSD